MSSLPPPEPRMAPALGPAQRLHAALMADYNRPATLYWWAVVLLGTAALGWSVQQLVALPWTVTSTCRQPL